MHHGSLLAVHDCELFQVFRKAPRIRVWCAVCCQNYMFLFLSVRTPMHGYRSLGYVLNLLAWVLSEHNKCLTACTLLENLKQGRKHTDLHLYSKRLNCTSYPERRRRCRTKVFTLISCLLYYPCHFWHVRWHNTFLVWFRTIVTTDTELKSNVPLIAWIQLNRAIENMSRQWN